MKITGVHHLFGDLGWRKACFLKIVTQDGIVGWSEYSEHAGNAGLTGVIHALAELIIGKDPREVERIAALLRARTLQTGGGINQHAIAAITNALLDIKGKALNVPVCDLFGGRFRDRVPVYWSHCGTYRVRHWKILGVPELKSYDDLAKLGEEARKRGFKALKTSILPFDDGHFVNFSPAFGHTPGFPALDYDHGLLSQLRRQLAAFRAGAGDDLGLMLDVNFHFKVDGFCEVARAVADYDLTWLELDAYDPNTVAAVRRAARCSIASGEALIGARDLKPFLDAAAMDIAVIDVTWNGYLEAIKMAALADLHDINVAPHNYGGLLGEAIGLHFAAAIPNHKICEIEVDDVPWKADFYSGSFKMERGELCIPETPGWGIEVNEAAVKRRPVK